MKYFSSTSTAVAIALSAFISPFAAAESAEPTAALPSALAEKNLLTDITLAGDKIVAVGERGHILYSNDGVKWSQGNVPVNVLLTSVYFKDENVGFAAGHDATLLTTTDGGENWSIAHYSPALDKPFLDITYSSDTVIAVGAYGMYFQSTDLGSSWQSVFHDELLIEDDRLFLQDIKEFEPENYDREKQYLLPHFNQLDVTSTPWRMVGEAGFVATSDDNGDNWQLSETDYIGSYFATTTLSDQTLLAGLRGNVFKGEDDNWQQIPVAAPATINQVIVHDNKAYLFANSGNIFLISEDKTGHKLFADGKAVLSGVIFNEQLVLATESGIKTLPLSELSL